MSNLTICPIGYSHRDTGPDGQLTHGVYLAGNTLEHFVGDLWQDGIGAWVAWPVGADTTPFTYDTKDEALDMLLTYHFEVRR